MSYVESHQEIASHPKTKRAARRLGISIPTLVGHLHILWHWALDYAPDGELVDFDPEDIADGAMWDGDPEQFIEALIDCGPGDRAGFIERENGRLWLHDWDDYGGKLLEKKRRDADRKRDVRRTSDGHPTDVGGTAQVDKKREEEIREEEGDIHPLARLAQEEIPDWQPDDEKDEALIRRHLKRLPADEVERVVLQLAGYPSGKYKDLRRALNNWLSKEKAPPPSRGMPYIQIPDEYREAIEQQCGGG